MFLDRYIRHIRGSRTRSKAYTPFLSVYIYIQANQLSLCWRTRLRDATVAMCETPS